MMEKTSVKINSEAKLYHKKVNEESSVLRYSFTSKIAATGQITVNEQVFSWDGFALNEEQVERVHKLALWDFARKMGELMNSEVDNITATQDDSLWTSTVKWKVDGHPSIAVVVPGFVTFADAEKEARKEVAELIKILAPPQDEALRKELLTKDLPHNRPQWIQRMASSLMSYC